MGKVYFACTPAHGQPGALAIAGDSITAGPPYVTLAESWGAQLHALLGSTAYTNGGHGGEYSTNMVSRAAAEIDPAFSKIGHPVAILEIATNDIASGLYSVAQAEANCQTWISARRTRGFTVGLCTILDRTSILTVSKATFDANRALFNAWVRAGSSGADFIVDFDTDSRLLLASNVTYFGDGVHPTAAGAAIMGGIGNVAVRTALAALAN